MYIKLYVGTSASVRSYLLDLVPATGKPAMYLGR